jgi:outer membrane immunogenic protein
MKMRRFKYAVLTTVAVVGLSSVAYADGADRARRAVAPVAVAAPSWTGFYAGVNAGGYWAKEDSTLAQSGSWILPGTEALFPGTFASAGVANALGTGSLKQSGFTGGIQVGANYQAGAWVFGFETDLNVMGKESTFAGAGPYGFNGLLGNVCVLGGPCTQAVSGSYKADALITARPRIGYAFNNWLVYGTGGFATAHVKASQSVSFNAPGLPGFQIEGGQTNNWQPGWAYGGGVEWMFNPHWTVKAEYIHADFKSQTFNLFNPLNATFYGYNSSKLSLDIARLGLNYKF